MAQFVDRRLNPRDKSLGNRQRFLRRVRSEVKRAVDKAVAERAIADVSKGGSVSIPTDGIDEPQFHLSGDSGEREFVLPGNKDFVAGDVIDKPKGKAGGGGQGREGAGSGRGEDPFSFALTEAEFLDILFEDLELPDLVKTSLKDAKAKEFRRAGYTSDGATPNLAVLRTMRVSMGRRMALRRPSASEVERLEAELEALRANPHGDIAERQRIVHLAREIERLKRRQRAIPFIDPIDVRYSRFSPVLVPRAKAVMFCLMDVSASMGEREKELAKRFFILLHLFLKRKYERVDIVFIRHTDEAAEVDEQEFFYGRETGGTVVSSALKEMMAIREARYPVADWNVYCAQASDGDNSGSRLARMRGAADAIDSSARPVLRLYRDRRRGRAARPQRQGIVARLRRPEGGCAGLRDGSRRRPRRHLPRLPQAFRQAADQGSRVMTATLEAARPLHPAGHLLFDGAEWDFETVHRVYDAIDEIAREELGLEVFPNQIEIISAEQMLDAYSSVGMPLMYAHWSYGKRFARDEALYRKGYTALAYEIVINSNPCISYCMEENTMAMQTLVIAHAAFGHNHFFRNNYLFQQWTDPAGILDYLDFAKHYVAACEERYGVEAVERTIDAAHALMGQGVFRYPRAPKLNLAEYERRRRERIEREEHDYVDLWRTVPGGTQARDADDPAEEDVRERKRSLRLPEENLLYFLEKNSPKLRNWQRELLRIVRNVAQYFYPQRQTKVMNEGCATFVHYTIVNRLYDKGLISEGALLEILHSHANVVAQFDYNDPRFGGFNPYALGFAMMQDIRRICETPTDEDRAWFPDIAGRKDWAAVLRDVWANYRDESFIRQFLSPRLIRQFRLFALADKATDSKVRVEAIHDDEGYRHVRSKLADSYDVGATDPDIQVVGADVMGDRPLILRHTMRNGVGLSDVGKEATLRHLRWLWGYEVRLEEAVN